MKRAYGSEPVLLHTSPISPLLAPHKKKRLGKKFVLFSVVGAVLVLGSASGWFAWQVLRTKDIFTPSVREAVHFPLYQPKNLPEGFAVDEGSINTTAGLVTFSINYNKTRRVVVTEQAKPDGFDFESFHDQIDGKKDLITYIGSAAVGQFEETDFASIVAPKTWVLVRAPSGIEPGAFEQVVQSFR